MRFLTFSPLPWWLLGAVTGGVLVLRYRARRRLENARDALSRIAMNERATQSALRPRSGRVDNVVPRKPRAGA